MFQILHDRPLEFGDALERAAADTLSGDLGKKALDHVEPGTRGRRKVQMEAGMRFPALHGRGLVGGIVIDDEMEIETSWGLLVEQFEKPQELAMPMTRHASPNDTTVEHVQRCEQGRS